jgi:hypothetical protein
MAAQKARESESAAVMQSVDGDELPNKDLPDTDTDAPAQLALSNSTEAVADDGPVQGIETDRPNKFVVEADDKVWIQVKIDEKETQSEILYPGDRREWDAARILQVVIGNAGGIRMRWNGQQLEAPRNSGRVLRFRLPDYAKAE